VRRLTYLSLLILLGFGLRVHLLGSQELRGDEGFSWNYIQKPPLEILSTIVREGDPQPPLHYWLQWDWLQLTGDSEFAMRAWSAFLSLLLIPLMFQVGARLWRAEVGCLAAGLTAIHPQQIWLAQDVRNMYQLALVFLLVATLLLPRLAGRTFREAPRLWLVYIGCGVVAMYSHYYALFYLTAHGAYFIFKGDSLRNRLYNLGRWAIAGLVIGLLVLPWGLVILPVYAGGQLADPGHLSLGQYAWASFGDLLAGPAQTEAVKTGFIWAGVVLGFVGVGAVLTLASKNFKSALLYYLLAGIVLPFFGIYAVIATRSTFNTFYFSFAFPAIYILIAGAVYFLYRKFVPVGVGVAILGVLALSVGLFNHYYNPDYTKTRGFREIASYLAIHAQPDDIYLANAPDPAQVYYIHNLNLNYHMEPGRSGLTPEEVDAQLGPLTAQRIWFVPANTALDPSQHVRERLNEIALKAEDQVLYRTTLLLYLPPSEAQPLAAQFEDGIRLVGYYYTPNRLTLVWETEAVPQADYTIFVHADATGDAFTLNGQDSPPHMPTSQWKPGQLIVDVHELDVPTDQSVTLVTGLYLPETGQRLGLQTEGWGEENAAKVITLSP
jgi:Dolichyl-phosphate-mannose-protein mannosyltransferase